jgi:class 3 adenylate cyclase
VEMTVVFADLSSFTEMTSHMGANATYSVVDEFLRLASTTLMRHGAFIDKYIGDAVMALFNVPINAPTMWRPRSPRLRSYKSFFPNFPEAWEFNSPQKMGFRSVAMARGMRWEEHFVNPAFKSVNGRDCD